MTHGLEEVETVCRLFDQLLGQYLAHKFEREGKVELILKRFLV